MTDQEPKSKPDGLDVQSSAPVSPPIENSEPGDLNVQSQDSVSPPPAESPAPAETLAETPAEQPAPSSPAEEPTASQAPEQPAQEDSPAPKPERRPERKQPEQPTAVVRYGLNRNLGEFRYNPSKICPIPSQKVVVRTERGVELGTVVSPVTRDKPAPSPEDKSCGCGNASGGCGGGCGGASSPMAIDSDRLREYIKAEGNDYPFRRGGRILRAANPQDLIDFRHFKKSSTEASHYCKEKIAEMKLAMRLVSVEHLIGGERIIFYFNSEERVDFRILVKDLASRFRTRIEMRQVGARDEARLVADYERCGQRCCCQQYLKPLKPISMRMAKVQKATLDPSKISGRCGRLMCCLRYEDETYTTLKKNLPRKSSWIRTETLLGRVLDSQILTQLTRIALPDRTLTVVPIADIIERDLPEPSEDDLNNAVRDMNRARRQAQAAATGSYQPAPAPAAEKPADKPKRNSGRKEQPKGDQPKREGGGKRRRRRRKPAGQEQGQGQGQKQSQGQPKQGQPQGGQEKSPQGKSDSPSGEAKPKRLIKRRRRRRRKPSDGGQGPASPPAPQGS